MPTFAVPAEPDTKAVTSEGIVTDVVAWEINTQPSVVVSPVVALPGFSIDYVVFPGKRRYTYPAWVYDGWGVDI